MMSINKTRHKIVRPGTHAKISQDWPTSLWSARASWSAYPLAASRLLINFLIFHISTFLSALDSPSIPFVAIPTGWHSHFFFTTEFFLPMSVWFSSIRRLSNSPPVFLVAFVYVKIHVRLIAGLRSSRCQFPSITYWWTLKFSPPCAMF